MNEARQGQAPACSPLVDFPEVQKAPFRERLPVATTFPPNPDQTAQTPQGTLPTAPKAALPASYLLARAPAFLREFAQTLGVQAENLGGEMDRLSGWAFYAEEMMGDMVALAQTARELAERIEATPIPAVPVSPVPGV